MTHAQLLSACYEDTGYQSSPAAAVTARFTRYLNEGLQSLLVEPGLEGILDANPPLTFTTTAGTARYAISEGATTIKAITDRTNDRALSAMSLYEYRRCDPDPASTSGTPAFYVPLGASPVAVQPVDASAIAVKSTSASDTNTAHMTALTTGGYRRTLSVTMTGTTAAVISGSLTNIIAIEDFYLSAAAVGTVTLLEDEGSISEVELARITIGQQRPRYQAFYLYPTPASADTYYVDYRRELDLLVQTSDEPALPIDFHPMLVKYAAFREWELKDDARAGICRAQYEKWLSRLKYRLHQTGDSLPVARKGMMTGHSRLGGYFPADTWVSR